MTSALKKRVENKLFFTGMEERKNKISLLLLLLFFLVLLLLSVHASKPTEFVAENFFFQHASNPPNPLYSNFSNPIHNSRSKIQWTLPTWKSPATFPSAPQLTGPSSPARQPTTNSAMKWPRSQESRTCKWTNIHTKPQ